MKNKVAVITGGSRGIGKAITEAFSREGYKVAFLYRGEASKAEALIKELPGEAKAYQCNVASKVEVEDTFKKIYEDFGSIHVLINNAGITRDGLLLRMKEEDFTDVFDVNTLGSFHCVKAVIRQMSKQKDGIILNISSVVGLMGNAGQVNYAASKAALIGMTKSIAKEFGGKNIRCNAIAPGFIETDMTKSLVNKELEAGISLPRLGKPEDIAEACVFLASDKASYITGITLQVDGGLGM